MDCPKCGKNAIQFIKDNKLVYKCLDRECGAETDKVLFGEDDNKIENVSNNNKFELNELGSGEVSILISNLKKIRTSMGYNQTEVSEKLGISTQRYGAIERCYNIPTISKVMDIAYVYGASFDDLYTGIRISRGKYNILKFIIAKPDGESYILEIDNSLMNMEAEINRYREDNNILDSRVFKEDSIALKKKKLNFQKMESTYKDYRKKKLAILKYNTVIDYFDWINAQKYLK